nr:hypothetical protein [Bacillota bacterium]
MPGRQAGAQAAELMQKYHAGGVLLFSGNVASPAQLQELTDGLQRLARQGGADVVLIAQPQYNEEEKRAVERLAQAVREGLFSRVATRRARVGGGSEYDRQADSGKVNGLDKLLVAVDGGGSKTKLWVLDTSGRVVAEGRGGPSTVTVVGIEAATQAVADGARSAGLAGLGEKGGDAEIQRSVGHVEQVAVAAAVVAGTEPERERTGLQNGMAGLFPKAQIVLRHDADGALLAGTLGDPGILILSGTGSVCLSMGPGGQRARVGGWGPLVDDGGSGYWIGREAIRLALRAADGRDEPTVLTKLLAERAQVSDVRELPGAVHRGDFGRPWIARLTPLVAQAAQDGDAAANRILDQAAEELAEHVRAALARSPWFDGVEEVPVVAAGGIFAMGEFWRRRFRTALAKAAPRAKLTVWVKEPIVGAVYLALRAYYGTIPDDVMAQLRALRDANVEPLS